MIASEKVLVIGDDMRSFLATVRSLGRQGLDVHVAPFDLSAPALTSRYISKIHSLPVYLDGGSLWLDAVTHLLSTEGFSLVIPCDERSLLPLVRHAAELAAYSKLSIPDARSMELFFDKHATRELATSLSIPVAAGKILAPSDTASSVVAVLGLPMIAKYRQSFAWPEIYVRTKASVIRTDAELAQWLTKNREHGDAILFEHMFPGIGVGVSVLCNQGTVLQAFEHHRVREFDGSGYYRKSAPLDQSRLSAVSKLVAASAYTGIAMFEFKVDPDTSNWILLEVNARPWGSLPLPVAIGIDFPYRLYRLLAHGENTAAIDYPYNLYGRNLVADFWQARGAAQSMLRSPVKLAGYLCDWLFGFRRVLLGREFHDGSVKDDRQPGKVELKNTLAELTSTLRSKLFGWKKPRRSGLKVAITSLSQANHSPINILVICDGNICRSPYAAIKLQQLLTQYGNRFEICSAGMLPRNRRSSPQVAIDAAARRGVAMAGHRSQYAFAPLIEAASLILIFDMVNHDSLLTRYPAHMEKVFFVGELAGNGGAGDDISDPIGRSAAGFDKTYTAIDACLLQLVDQIKATIKTGTLNA